MLSKKKLSRTFASIDASSEDFLATSRLSDSVLRQCVLKLNQFSCITKQSFLITDWSGAGLISYLFFTNFSSVTHPLFLRSVFAKPNEDFLVFAVATICFLSSIGLHCVCVLFFSHIYHIFSLCVARFSFFVCLYSDSDFGR